MDASGAVKRAKILVCQRLTSLPTNPTERNENAKPTGQQRSKFFIPDGGGALFYAIRDNNLVSGGDIQGSTEFALLEDLYVRYCQATNWPKPGHPVAFYARNIAR